MTNLEKYTQTFCDTLGITEDQTKGLEYQGLKHGIQ